MKKSLVIFFILIAVLVVQPGFVFSEEEESLSNRGEIELLNKEIKERKDKVKEIEKSIEVYKKKINQKRLEAVSLSNQMSILDNRILQVELDIEMTEEKLDTLSLEVEAMELSIEEKERTMDKQKMMIAGLMRDIYQQDNKNFIEVLAAYDNFSEFYDKLQYLETIEENLGKAARGLRISKEELEEKKEQVEERELAYEKLNEKLLDKKKDLDENVFQKQDLFTQTKSSEAVYSTLLVNLRKQYQEIESEINGIEREVRKRMEEQGKLDQISDDGDGLLSWPAPSRYITAYFYDKDYPYRHIFEHNAVDIRAAQGTLIRASASGYVARAKKCYTWQCYSYVMIVHTDGVSTVYGHLSNVIVGEDQFVVRGDVVGYSGAAPKTIGAGPFTTGPHLHFEVRKNGIPVNPLNYLVKDY